MSSPESGLFPLPLTPLEYYYLCDNRPDYPTAFPAQLQFSGRLDRDAFGRALAGVLARHPMLTARVGRLPNGIPAWTPGDGSPPPLDWGREGEPIRHAQGPAIDLAAAPGLRAWVREGDGTSRLLLQFHHACCDGWAALQFMEELLIAYHIQIQGSRCGLVLRPLRPDRLGDRGRLESPPHWWQRFRDLLVGARLWSQWTFRRPAVLAPGRPAPAEIDAPLLDFQTVELGRELTLGLRQAAIAAGGSLHDVLLCNLFRCIRDWNRQQGSRDRRPIRINVPLTIRDRDDRLLPAANRLTFAFLARGGRQLADPQRLLEGIGAEMQAIRQKRLGLYFVGGLGTFCQVPGLIPFFLGRRHSFATAVLSFGGRLFARSLLPRVGRRLAAGNVVLEVPSGVPPIRPLTRAAIGIGIYDERMIINVRCDPQYFSRDDTCNFADLYLQSLTRTAGHLPSPACGRGETAATHARPLRNRP
jgi:hypothetical protein